MGLICVLAGPAPQSVMKIFSSNLHHHNGVTAVLPAVNSDDVGNPDQPPAVSCRHHFRLIVVEELKRGRGYKN